MEIPQGNTPENSHDGRVRDFEIPNIPVCETEGIPHSKRGSKADR
jgi:hypothetical protein